MWDIFICILSACVCVCVCVCSIVTMERFCSSFWWILINRDSQSDLKPHFFINIHRNLNQKHCLCFLLLRLTQSSSWPRKPCLLLQIPVAFRIFSICPDIPGTKLKRYETSMCVTKHYVQSIVWFFSEIQGCLNELKESVTQGKKNL